MTICTADLWDEYADQLSYLNLPLLHYGKKHSFYGEVITLKVFEDNTFVRELLSTNGKGKVLVIDGGGSTRCALVGDNIAQLAIDNEWSGILVYGAIRDSAIIKTMDIGLLALGTCSVKSIKNNVGYPHQELLINGTKIQDKQYLYADADGVLLSDAKLI